MTCIEVLALAVRSACRPRYVIRSWGGAGRRAGCTTCRASVRGTEPEPLVRCTRQNWPPRWWKEETDSENSFISAILIQAAAAFPIVKTSILRLPYSSSITEQSFKMPNIIRDIRTVETEAFPYIFEQNVSIQLKSNQQAVARANVYRPKNVERAPVLITYGPYGKDIPYEE